HGRGLVVEAFVAEVEVALAPVAGIGAEPGLAAGGRPDLFVARFVGDHRHLSRRWFGPVRQRHGAGRLSGGGTRWRRRSGTGRGTGIITGEAIGREREPGGRLDVFGGRGTTPP